MHSYMDTLKHALIHGYTYLMIRKYTIMVRETLQRLLDRADPQIHNHGKRNITKTSGQS